MQLATFNGTLAPGFVTYVEERKQPAITATAALPADILCVQEFWEEHLTDLAAATSATLPNTVTRAAEPGELSACTVEEAAPLIECARTNCSDVLPDDLADCAFMFCSPEINGVSSPCISCIAAELGNPIDDIETACTGSGSGSYAYGGSFGLGIFAADEIVAQDSLVFESKLKRRAVLYGQIAADIGDVHVFCTHLTAALPVPYPGEGSWDGEQRDQITTLLGYIDEKTEPGDQVILMGDLNISPATANTAAEAAANYEMLIADGFINPYIDRGNSECTYCPGENPLIEDDGSTPLLTLDHILIREIPGLTSNRRLLTDTITISVEGQTVDTSYSSHYGLELGIDR